MVSLLCSCTVLANETTPILEKASAVSTVAADHVPLKQIFDHVYDTGVQAKLQEFATKLRSMTVRFFEDDAKVLTLGFDK